MLAAVQACQRSLALLTARLRLYLEQLVADPRRRLEIEVGGRFPHLGFQLRDERRQIVLSVMRSGLGDPAALFLFPFLAVRPRVRDARDEPHLVHTLLDAYRRDSVLAVVRLLQLAAPTCLLDASLHRSRHLVGVKDGAPAQVPGGPA